MKGRKKVWFIGMEGTREKRGTEGTITGWGKAREEGREEKREERR